MRTRKEEGRKDRCMSPQWSHSWTTQKEKQKDEMMINIVKQ